MSRWRWPVAGCRPTACSSAHRSSARVAAVSCGVVDGSALLDLDYPEDSRAEVDANVVMTGDGGLVEVQATAERTPLSRASLDELLALAADGIAHCGPRSRRRSRKARPEARPRDGQPAQARGVRRLLGGTSNWSRCRRRSCCRRRTATTFAENALGKARAAAAQTGRPAIADDSGIEAQALGGRPGVRSARYAGEDASDAQNLALLIAEVPVGSALRYVCVIASSRVGGRAHVRGALRWAHGARAAR